MELSGTRIIAADVATVWAHLNDAETLRACIPGCEDLSGSPHDGFSAVVKQKVGPVKATFKGSVQLENVIPGESYTITGEGKGGVAGFAKGGADVVLTAVDAGTGRNDHLHQAEIAGPLLIGEDLPSADMLQPGAGDELVDGVRAGLEDQNVALA